MLKSCSRPGCLNRAIAQLTYSYALSQVEVVDVDSSPGPAAYVLCQTHLDRFKIPKGWTLIRSRQQTPAVQSAQPSTDIEAIAAEIRRVGGVSDKGVGDVSGTELSLSKRENLVMLATRAHLRVVADRTLG